MSFFNAAIERLLDIEGGYVNDPNDPGGETKYGISKRSYPHLNIAELTRAEAIEIYRHDFWMVAVLDQYPAAISYQLLDAAVHHGIGTALRMLQRAVGVADDGHIGPVTLSALATVSDTDLVMRFLAERLAYMTRLRNWKRNATGWALRIVQDLRYAADDT